MTTSINIAEFDLIFIGDYSKGIYLKNDLVGCLFDWGKGIFKRLWFNSRFQSLGPVEYMKNQ